jgi:hypothetical protein
LGYGNDGRLFRGTFYQIGRLNFYLSKSFCNFSFYRNLVDKKILDFEGVFIKKRKKRIKVDITEEEEALRKYSEDCEDEIAKTYDSISNLESKNKFFTPDEVYEQIDIPEYCNTENRKMKMKNKNIIFDIQIKNADDYVYEKIIID